MSLKSCDEKKPMNDTGESGSEDETDTPTLTNFELQDSRSVGRRAFYNQLCNLKYKLILYFIIIFIFCFEIFREILLESFFQQILQKWENITHKEPKQENEAVILTR